MRSMLTAMVLGLTVGPSPAAPPAVPAKVTIQAGKLARIEFPVEGDKEVLWASGTSEENLFVDEAVAAKGKKKFLVQGYEPGVYRVIFATVGERETVYTEVEVTGPGGTDKKKDPIPPVSTAVGPLRAYLVTESADKTASWSKILQDKDVGAWWTGGKNKEVQRIDPNIIDPQTGKTPDKWKKFVSGASGKPSYLYLVDSDTGEVLWEGQPPTTPADTLALFKNVRPKN